MRDIDLDLQGSYYFLKYKWKALHLIRTFAMTNRDVARNGL